MTHVTTMSRPWLMSRPWHTGEALFIYESFFFGYMTKHLYESFLVWTSRHIWMIHIIYLKTDVYLSLFFCLYVTNHLYMSHFFKMIRQIRMIFICEDSFTSDSLFFWYVTAHLYVSYFFTWVVIYGLGWISYEWVMSYTNETCHKWMSHVTHSARSYADKLVHTQQRLATHLMSHVTQRKTLHRKS